MVITIVIAVAAIAVVVWVIYTSLFRRAKDDCSGDIPGGCSHCAVNEYCSIRGPRLIEVDAQVRPISGAGQ